MSLENVRERAQEEGEGHAARFWFRCRLCHAEFRVAVIDWKHVLPVLTDAQAGRSSFGGAPVWMTTIHQCDSGESWRYGIADLIGAIRE